MTWIVLNIEEETQLATRGKGGQGKLMSLYFIPQERLKKHVVNVLISQLHIGPYYSCPPSTAVHEQTQYVQGKD